MEQPNPTAESDHDRTEIEAGPAHLPDELFQGVYANAIRSIASTSEVIIDFSLIAPTQWERSDGDIKLSEPVRHRVVSRVIVPPAAFREWVAQIVRRLPTQGTPNVTDEADDAEV